ncbi:P-loop containing nucleoside triphosphate hydrolase protein [Syncephalastrum racemosum]|uniref:P-loop containing nucleoside triphosphate hydrolase protein n=1 Tax=Syncephalastrum racemosum TaxID=13706 RepID=A0A1X2HAE2_SYNRA|nr:P-loop containing nucleoside triphosphate hydrolase protein [Syncephalastrum racemosum]
MARLKIIGAGHIRTGTDSLRLALNQLGYNTHHMASMMECDRKPEAFVEAYKHPDKPVDWDTLYEGFDAACDCPTTLFVERLANAYPDAKVILIERDSESWYNSMYHTGHQGLLLSVDPVAPEHVKKTLDMSRTLLWDGAIANADRFSDKEAMKKMYEAHNENIKKVIPAERLLVVQLGQFGWKELCDFLDKPVPDVPYPHGNTTAEFQKNFRMVIGRDEEQAQ